LHNLKDLIPLFLHHFQQQQKINMYIRIPDINDLVYAIILNCWVLEFCLTFCFWPVSTSVIHIQSVPKNLYTL
jgi:hypothetical protein